MTSKEKVLFFKALSDENRWSIMEILKDGEQCACVILEKLNITQATLSYHMKNLVDSKIVNADKRGKWVYYSINQKSFEFFVEQLKKFM